MFKLKISTKQSGAAKHEKKSSSSSRAATAGQGSNRISQGQAKREEKEER